MNIGQSHRSSRTPSSSERSNQLESKMKGFELKYIDYINHFPGFIQSPDPSKLATKKIPLERINERRGKSTEFQSENIKLKRQNEILSKTIEELNRKISTLEVCKDENAVRKEFEEKIQSKQKILDKQEQDLWKLKKDLEKAKSEAIAIKNNYTERDKNSRGEGNQGVKTSKSPISQRGSSRPREYSPIERKPVSPLARAISPKDRSRHSTKKQIHDLQTSLEKAKEERDLYKAWQKVTKENPPIPPAVGIIINQYESEIQRSAAINSIYKSFIERIAKNSKDLITEITKVAHFRSSSQIEGIKMKLMDAIRDFSQVKIKEFPGSPQRSMEHVKLMKMSQEWLKKENEDLEGIFRREQNRADLISQELDAKAMELLELRSTLGTIEKNAVSSAPVTSEGFFHVKKPSLQMLGSDAGSSFAKLSDEYVAKEELERIEVIFVGKLDEVLQKLELKSIEFNRVFQRIKGICKAGNEKSVEIRRRLAEELEKLIRKNQRDCDVIEELRNRVKELEGSKNLNKLEVEKVKAVSEARRAEISRLNEDIERLKAQLKVANDSAGNSEKFKAQSLDHGKRLREEVEKLSRDNEAKAGEINKLERIKTELFQQINALSSANGAKDSEIDTMRQEIDKKEKEIVENKIECADLVQEIQKLKSLNENLEDLLEKARVSNKGFAEENKNLKKSLLELQADLEKVKEISSTYSIENNSLKEAIFSLTTAAAELKTIDNQLHEESSNSKTLIASLSEDLSKLQALESAQSEKISQLKLSETQNQEEILRLTEQINSHRTEISYLIQSIESLSESELNLKNASMSHSVELEEAKKFNATQALEIEALSKLTDSLKSQIESLTETHSLSESQLLQSYNSLQKQYESILKEAELYKKKLRLSEDACDRLHQEVFTIRTELKSVQSQLPSPKNLSTVFEFSVILLPSYSSKDLQQSTSSFLTALNSALPSAVSLSTPEVLLTHLSSLGSEIQSLSSSNSALSKSLTESAALVLSLSQDLSLKDSSIAAISLQLEGEQSQNKELTNALSIQNEDLIFHKEDSRKKAADYKKLSEEFFSLQSNYEGLISEKLMLSEEIEELKHSTETQSLSLSILEEKLQQSEGIAEIINKENEDLKKEIESRVVSETNLKDELNNKIDAITAYTKDLKTQSESWEKLAVQHEQQVLKQTQESSEEITKLKSQIKLINDEKDSLKNKLEQRIKELTENLDRLNTKSALQICMEYCETLQSSKASRIPDSDSVIMSPHSLIRPESLEEMPEIILSEDIKDKIEVNQHLIEPDPDVTLQKLLESIDSLISEKAPEGLITWCRKILSHENYILRYNSSDSMISEESKSNFDEVSMVSDTNGQELNYRAHMKLTQQKKIIDNLMARLKDKKERLKLCKLNIKTLQSEIRSLDLKIKREGSIDLEYLRSSIVNFSKGLQKVDENSLRILKIIFSQLGLNADEVLVRDEKKKWGLFSKKK